MFFLPLQSLVQDLIDACRCLRQVDNSKDSYRLSVRVHATASPVQAVHVRTERTIVNEPATRRCVSPAPREFARNWDTSRLWLSTAFRFSCNNTCRGDMYFVVSTVVLCSWKWSCFCGAGETHRRFAARFWIFWWFLGWISAKLPLIWSKMCLQHKSLPFLPPASRVSALWLGHVQKSKFGEKVTYVFRLFNFWNFFLPFLFLLFSCFRCSDWPSTGLACG